MRSPRFQKSSPKMLKFQGQDLRIPGPRFQNSRAKMPAFQAHGPRIQAKVTESQDHDSAVRIKLRGYHNSARSALCHPWVPRAQGLEGFLDPEGPPPWARRAHSARDSARRRNRALRARGTKYGMIEARNELQRHDSAPPFSGFVGA